MKIDYDKILKEGLVRYKELEFLCIDISKVHFLNSFHINRNHGHIVEVLAELSADSGV